VGGDDERAPLGARGDELVTEVVHWARRLQAIAQTGLAYGEPTQYDRDRYAQVRRIAAEMLGGANGAAALETVFAAEQGHATPKLDVRGAVFRGDRILLVSELADDGRWTLPGGWADVGESPSSAVEREVLEESGYRTRTVKLVALYDRSRHGHDQNRDGEWPHVWHTWKVFFLCELVGDERTALGAETGAAEFFPRDELPELSVARVTPEQIERLFELRDHPEWPADFD
jgi:ADP-ribose pyrophosphatase YjhB (NUDIX family)